jgi:2-polyprenyl-3-methyl-5-hydroxy-6-metoxy-1,4-benzoquinol methylase
VKDATCRICSGPLELRYSGRQDVPSPEEFAPTNHRPGEHGSLWACGECGTVQQAALPDGDSLRDLYREMVDDAYLDEEPGRRETARSLLDLIGRHVPAGRLLDVGCGHGLLLDEARRRGYEASGIELSSGAAAYAREVLALDVVELPLEEFEAAQPDASFNVIVLADLL